MQGFSQQKGIDYKETFAPVVRYSSIRFLLALSVNCNLHIHQLDAETAVLNSFLEENIFTDQSKGYSDDNNLVWLLRKALYGLKHPVGFGI